MNDLCPLCMEMHEKEKVSMLVEGLKDNLYMAEYYYCSKDDGFYEDEHLIRLNSKRERESRQAALTL